MGMADAEWKAYLLERSIDQTDKEIEARHSTDDQRALGNHDHTSVLADHSVLQRPRDKKAHYILTDGPS